MPNNEIKEKEIEGTLIFASVTEDAGGIHMRVATAENKLEIVFLPVNERLGDISLVLKEGMDAQEELQKVCNLLNGYLNEEDGTLSLIPGFVSKKIKIIKQ